MIKISKNSSVLAASIWMLFITALLFWLPALGPLIGGLVGGKKAGSTGKAIYAALLPAIVAGLFFAAFASSLTGLPLIGALAGVSGVVLVLGQVGPLLVGAIIGSIL